MPKPKEKRGRRMKRKHEEDPDDLPVEATSKRRKSIDANIEETYLPLEAQEEDMSAAYPPADRAFFGMLDESEQEYFKHADQVLEENAFSTPEEQAAFIETIYKEADGKELKIANSQSCSRILERLIRISTASQLKNLFQKFSGKYVWRIGNTQ